MKDPYHEGRFIVSPASFLALLEDLEREPSPSSALIALFDETDIEEGAGE